MLGLKTLARGHTKHVKGLAREAAVGIDSGRQFLDAVRNPQRVDFDNVAELELEDMRERKAAATRCMYFSFLVALAILGGLTWLSAVTGNKWMLLHAALWSAILAMYGWRMLVEEERLAVGIRERLQVGRTRKTTNEDGGM